MIGVAELERVADQYRSEGYAVVVRPQPAGLNGLGGIAADLLATRGGESVVVRVVRSRADVEGDPTVSRHAAAVNERAGWRYDLVVLEKGTDEPPPESVAEPTDEQLLAMIEHARKASAAGFKSMALTHAWAALEAAMRRVRSEFELYGPDHPGRTVEHLVLERCHLAVGI